MRSRRLRAFLKWFREPSSWLSLFAAVISALTFFLVYANPGKLRLFLADRIAVSEKKGMLSIVAPLTLSNTGAPRTRRHVLSIDANVMPVARDSVPTMSMRWEYEVQLVSRYEFHKRYPDAPDTADVVDIIDYVGRAFPFQVVGETATIKVFRFDKVTPPWQYPSDKPVELTLKVQTDRESVSVVGRYRCFEAMRSAYQWCPEVRPE